MQLGILRKLWRKKRLRLFFFILLAFLFLAAAAPFAVNAHVKSAARGRILEPAEAAGNEYDCILVLGAGVWDGGRPSPLLEDRLRRGVELYGLGAAPKLLMSGDHGREGYDEVNVMKQYAVDGGVPSEDVFMDHAGFSTYESLYRARDVFGVKKVLIVTQTYHLYRALYVAERLGLESHGVASDLQLYLYQKAYDRREFLARGKDFLYAAFQPKPTFLGEAIPVTGNGDVTNDQP